MRTRRSSLQALGQERSLVCVVWPGAKPVGEMFPRGLLLVLDLSPACFASGLEISLGRRSARGEALKMRVCSQA